MSGINAIDKSSVCVVVGVVVQPKIIRQEKNNKPNAGFMNCANLLQK